MSAPHYRETAQIIDALRTLAAEIDEQTRRHDDGDTDGD